MKRLFLTPAFGLARSARRRTPHSAHPDGECARHAVRPGPDSRSSRRKTGIDVDIEADQLHRYAFQACPAAFFAAGRLRRDRGRLLLGGEFTQAGWLMPLDDLIKRDNVDTSVYLPALMNLVGKVNGVTYMLPFYNYSMGIIYRKDLLDDPKEQAAFKAKYGMDLKIPTTWDEYKKQVEFFSRDTDGTASSIFTAPSIRASAAIASPCNGRTIYTPMAASITTRTGRRRSIARRASRRSRTSRPTSLSTGRQELRASALTRPPTSSARARPIASSRSTFSCQVSTIQSRRRSSARPTSRPIPGGGLNGGWGWAIPNSSQEKEAAWTFIKWIESKEIVKKRALEGGAPTQGWVFEDADIIAKRPEMPQLKVLVATAQEFPTFTYTVDFVESLGRELNLAVTGQKDAKQALDTAASDFNKLAAKAGLQK